MSLTSVPEEDKDRSKMRPYDSLVKASYIHHSQVLHSRVGNINKEHLKAIRFLVYVEFFINYFSNFVENEQVFIFSETNGS